MTEDSYETLSSEEAVKEHTVEENLTREDRIQRAVAMISDSSNTLSLQKICKLMTVSHTTMKRRLAGVQPRQQYNQQLQILSPEQELLLEEHILELAKQMTIPTSLDVREMAASYLRLFNPLATVPSKTWLTGFLKRSSILVRTKRNTIDVPRIRENGDSLIHLFFERLKLFEDRFNVSSDYVWNLDECGFRIGQTAEGRYGIVPVKCQNASYDSSEIITVLESISGGGDLLTPFLIYKGKYLMESWFPTDSTVNCFVSTSPSAFINSEIFSEWFDRFFPDLSEEGRWQILILDGHKSHTSSEFRHAAFKKKVIPLYLPAHMSHILQPLDRSPFGVAKQSYRRQIAQNFAEGHSPAKRHFFQIYNHLRPTVYRPEVIKGGWKRAGIFPRCPDIALQAFNHYMNRSHPTLPTLQPDTPISSSNTPSRPILTSEMNSPPSVSPRNASWRTTRMFWLNRLVKEVVTEVGRLTKLLGVSNTEVAQLKQNNTTLQNKLDGIEKRPTKKTRKDKDPNKLVLEILGATLAGNEANQLQEDDTASELSSIPDEE